METVRAQSLGSGSSGNALLLLVAGRALLIDHGISPRALKVCLAVHGLVPGDLDAMLITHEHTDHVHGLRAGLRATTCPVVGTSGTLTHLPAAASRSLAARPDVPLTIGIWEITALAVSHDAAEPCGYSVAAHGVRWTVLTDLGERCGGAAEYLAASDLLVVEANHDDAMLRGGPYPAHLKRRIASDRGHLSNAQAGAWLRDALRRVSTPKVVWLAHLSQTNNRAVLAVGAVGGAGNAAGIDLRPLALPRRQSGPVWHPGEPLPTAAPRLPLQLSLSL